MTSAVRSNWQRTILVCAKCQKRAGSPLAKRLRKAGGLKKGRKAAAGIVEVRCLGICPRDAVVVIDAAVPDRWTIVRADADPQEVAVMLGLIAP